MRNRPTHAATIVVLLSVVAAPALAQPALAIVDQGGAPGEARDGDDLRERVPTFAAQ